MSDQWDFYFANVNDATASMFVDLGIRDSVPDSDRPWLMWLHLHLNQPRDDGLSSRGRGTDFDDIEDALTPVVNEANGAELVGRVTTAGRRDFISTGLDRTAFAARTAAWAGSTTNALDFHVRPSRP